MLRLVPIAGLLGGMVWAGSAGAASRSSAAPQVSTVAATRLTVDANGDPIPFTVSASGFAPNQPVYLEICNGVSATATGWNPTSDCDTTTSGPSLAANDSGDVTFAVGSAYEVEIFRGSSPSDAFNCLAPQDTVKGTPAAGMGNVVPASHQTYPPDGDTVGYDTNQASPTVADRAVPSWNDCQLRISSDDATVTSNQKLVTLDLTNTPRATAPAFISPAHASMIGGETATVAVQVTGSPTPTLSDGGAALPSGVTFTSEGNGLGLLSGVPGSTGSFHFTLTATNTKKKVAQAFTLSVAAPAGGTIKGKAPVAVRGDPYKFGFTVGGTPAPTVSLVSGDGALPAGLELSAKGVLSGTPTKVGTSSFTLQAANNVSTSDLAVKLSVTAAKPKSIVTTAGSGQSARVGKTFAKKLAAKVKDADSRGVSGVKVTFKVTSGPAQFAGKSSVIEKTNASGVATSPTLTAGTKAGSVAVSASVAGLRSAATYKEKVTARKA